MRLCSVLPALLLTVLAPVGVLAQGAVWDLAEQPYERISSIYFSDPAGGLLGEPLEPGDFNGDGKLDVAGNTFSSSFGERSQNGSVKVFFGTGTLGATISEHTYEGPFLRIDGAVSGGYFGLEGASADIDHDGFTDLLVTANAGLYASDPGRELAGEAVILYGRPKWGGTVRALDIANLPADQRAEFIVGERESDRLGAWADIGDLDGDTFEDIILGMDQSDGPNADSDSVGAAVILWGTLAGRPPVTRIGEEATARDTTIIYGLNPGDLFGATFRSGDWDGDGMRDLAISAGVNRAGLQTNGFQAAGAGDLPGRADCGITTIFWEARRLKNFRRLALADVVPEELPTTTLAGMQAGSYFGEELFTADVTGDGVDDLLAGALTQDRIAPSFVPAVGAGFLFPGGAELRAAGFVDALKPQAEVGMTLILGKYAGGVGADTLNAFDINGDGRAEIFFSSPSATSTTGRTSNGVVDVLFGGHLPPVVDLLEVEANMTSVPWTRMFARDRGDLLAYSAAEGDFDGDGVVDYVANCMQGDGLDNRFNNAGEFYIMSGHEIAARAAAPNEPRYNTAGTEVTWRASQEIFGPVAAYRLHINQLFTPETRTEDVASSPTLVAAPADPFERIVKISALEQQGDTQVESFRAPVIQSAIPTPTPTATPEPTASPTPTPTSSPTPEPTPSPVPTQGVAFGFDTTEDGWTFGSAAEFTAPAPSTPAGALAMTARMNTGTFGFWQSPAIEAFPALADGPGVVLADFELASDLADAERVPGVRLRLFSQSNQHAEVIDIESNPPALYSPTKAGSVFRAAFRPQSHQSFSAAVDMLNFLPNDAPSATVSIRSVSLSAAPAGLLDNPRVERRYNFDGGANDFAFHTVPGEFTEPEGEYVSGIEPGLRIRTLLGSKFTFGYWSSHDPAPIVLEAGRMYFADFTVASDVRTADMTPSFRLRLNDSLFMVAAFLQVASTAGGANSPSRDDTRTYRVFLPPGVAAGADLLVSFDLTTQALDGDEPTAAITLNAVSVYSVAAP